MKHENIKISVIVPIYGIEEYLPTCIDSILSQTYKDIEIILVDDGSKDNCPAICDNYLQKDSRIKVIHKPNGGLVSARKAGISIATGDYICHVDGDDWLENEYVDNFVDIIKRFSPEMVCSGEIRAYPDKKVPSPLQEREGYYNREQIVSEILPALLERKDGYYLNHANQLKCIEKKLAFDSLQTVDCAISMSEDHACSSVTFTRAKSLYVSKKCLYNYRISPTSMTNAKKVLPWAYPKNMVYHFTHNVDLTLADLQEQFYRAISHFIFNTAVSQFNSDRNYRIVCNDIDRNLNEYNEIISKASYSKLSHRLMLLALKYRWHIAMKAYAFLRYR